MRGVGHGPSGIMVPEFDAVAMSLKEGEVSQVFKTQYGYHFMQLVERRGESYNARHVLMRPQWVQWTCRSSHPAGQLGRSGP